MSKSKPAPTIDKRQQKKALSASKKKKQTVKNVLVKPQKQYWPLLDGNDLPKLLDLLKTHLPRIRARRPKISWKDIKNIPKEDRKDFRKKYESSEDKVDRKERIGLYFGVNAVGGLLDENLAECVLISHDVKPKLLVQHILDQSQSNNVPLLVVENLRNVLTDTCGITSTTIAFSMTIPETSRMARLVKTIKLLHYRIIPAPQPLEAEVSDTSDFEIIETQPPPSPRKPTNKAQLLSKYLLEKPADGSKAFDLTTLNAGKRHANASFIDLEPGPSTGDYFPLIVKRVKNDGDREKRLLKN